MYPFLQQNNVHDLSNNFWRPFAEAWSPIQRRQQIFLAGTNEIDGTDWVLSAGYFQGLFDKSWLGIPANHKLAFLRYAEFFNVQNNKITKASFFCDILDVMYQAGLKPLPSATAWEGLVPGPKSCDGINLGTKNPKSGEKTMKLVDSMVADLNKLNISGDDSYPPEILQKTWHTNMSWYGPSGIGSTYTIERYQKQHSYPFRQGLRDKKFNGHICRFSEGNYACFFGWPNLTHTPIGGFLGLPGSGCSVEMRVADIYRREGDKLAENWVLIDLLWWLKQQGLDILKREANTTFNY